MAIAENLPRFLDDKFHFCCAYDFKGSSTSRFADTRIRRASTEGVIYGSHDLDTEYHGYIADDQPPLPSCSPAYRQTVENSFWFCTWWGQVSGSVLQSFQLAGTSNNEALPQIFAPALFPKATVRLVLILSVDGGPITQVEKSHLPTLLHGTLGNIRRRGYEWSTAAEVVWCHFPTTEDMLESMAGTPNLVHDWANTNGVTHDVHGRPTTLTCPQPHDLPAKAKRCTGLFKPSAGKNLSPL